MFKGRCWKKKYKLNNQLNTILISNVVFYFELHYLRIIKRLVKKLKKIHINKTKVWFLLTTNFYIFKKPVNSRMGKGKGKFMRSAIKIKKYAIILKFIGFKYKELVKFNNNLYKKSPLKTKIIDFFKKKEPYNNKQLQEYYNSEFIGV